MVGRSSRVCFFSDKTLASLPWSSGFSSFLKSVCLFSSYENWGLRGLQRAEVVIGCGVGPVEECSGLPALRVHFFHIPSTSSSSTKKNGQVTCIYICVFFSITIGWGSHTAVGTVELITAGGLRSRRGSRERSSTK